MPPNKPNGISAVQGSPLNNIPTPAAMIESPKMQLEEVHKPLQKMMGHAKFAKKMVKVGGAAINLATNPEDLMNQIPLDQVPTVPGLTNVRKQSVNNEGDEFYSIVDDYATPFEAISFPRISDAINQPLSAAMSPETDQTHGLPEHQTPRDYGVSDVLVADRMEPFNDFYNSTFSNGVSVDPEGFRHVASGWPSSASVAKTYVDHFPDVRPKTAPLMPTTDDVQKKVKRKKSDLRGGIKGVKDSIRDIGRGTRSRLTSFSSRKSVEAGNEEGSSSERNHSIARTHTNSNEDQNSNWTPQFHIPAQRPAYDPNASQRQQWEGRGEHGGQYPDRQHQGSYESPRRGNAPPVMQSTPPQRRPKPPSGQATAMGYDPSRRMAWTGSTQWEQANSKPSYGTAL